MKKFFTMLVILLVPIIVNATNYSFEDLTMSVDENWMVFTLDNIDNNEYLENYGISSSDLKEQMISSKMYLDAISSFDNENYLEMFLFIKQAGSSVKNLHMYKDKDIMEVGKEVYKKNNYDTLDIYKTNKYSFVYCSYADSVKGQTLYVTDYYTVINGNGYTFKFQSPAKIGDVEKSNMEKVIMSINFKKDKEYEKSPYKNKLVPIIIYAIIGGVLGAAASLLKRKIKR